VLFYPTYTVNFLNRGHLKRVSLHYLLPSYLKLELVTLNVTFFGQWSLPFNLIVTNLFTSFPEFLSILTS
jgi:hypothetical protein